MERRVLTSLDGAIKAFDWLLAGKPAPVYFDIETTGLSRRSNRFVTWAFHVEGRGTVICDLRHATAYGPWKALVRPIFDGSRLVVGHNLKFDLGFMQHQLGIRALRVFDTMLAEQIIAGLGTSEAEELQYGFNLLAVAARRGIQVSKEERNWFIDLDQRIGDEKIKVTFEPLLPQEYDPHNPDHDYDERYGQYWGKTTERITGPKPWDLPLPEEQINYIAQDVEILPAIVHDQTEKLRKHKLMEVASLEFRALPAFVDLEVNGMFFRVEGWRQIIAEKETEARQIESEVMQTFIPIIARGLDEKFKPLRAAWCAWRDRKEDYKAAAKIFYDTRVRTAYAFPEVHEEEKWIPYRQRVMEAWKEANPEPRKPARELPTPNLGSPEQVKMALSAIGLNIHSTQSRFLEPFQERHPEVKLLLAHRKANKFVTSFGENLLSQGVEGEWVYEDEEGVEHKIIAIHPDIQQIGASTGRTSMRRPNLQQIPARGPDGKRMRSMIVARKGHKMLTADFSNIELRILAELSQDETMIRLFNQGLDLHAETARFMFKLAPDADVKQLVPGLKLTYRDVAKSINFGLMYGMSAHRLKDILKCSLDEASELLDRYFAFYPGVRAWLDGSNEQVLSEMVSRTRTNRWRKYSLGTEPVRTQGEDWQTWKERHDDWKRKRARIARQGTNMRVQGLSADITKEALAMIAANSYIGIRLVAVVHDEIVIEVPDKLVQTGKAFLAGHMWNACTKYLKLVNVPEIDVAVSGHWSKE